jgi:hypothetical protein
LPHWVAEGLNLRYASTARFKDSFRHGDHQENSGLLAQVEKQLCAALKL